MLKTSYFLIGLIIGVILIGIILSVTLFSFINDHGKGLCEEQGAIYQTWQYESLQGLMIFKCEQPKIEISETSRGIIRIKRG